MKKCFKLIVVVIILLCRFLSVKAFNSQSVVLKRPAYLSAYPPPGPSFLTNHAIVRYPKARIKFARSRRENDGKSSSWGGRLISSLTSGNLLGSSSNSDYEDDSYASATGYGHGGSYGSGYGSGGHGGAYGGSGHGNGHGFGGGGYSGGYGGGGSGYGGGLGGGYGPYGGGGGGYGAYGGGGDGGGGHGHSGGGGYGKGGLNKSAVGLLGFLSLLSLIQTVLNQTTTTAAPMGRMPAMPGRKKRDFGDNTANDGNNSLMSQSDKIIHLLLPVLSAIAHARSDELIPVHCTLRQVCLANQMLVKELGNPGRSVGILLSDGIGKILDDAEKHGKIVTIVKRAGKAGRSGKNNCQKLYKECSGLINLPHYHIPSTMIF